MRLDRTLWLTSDGKVVEDGDPAAAFLLGNAGTEIADDEAARLGVKAKAKPADKSRKPAENK